MSDKTVKINVEAFTAHHDECLAIADELHVLTESLSPISVSLATVLNVLANRLDKSISKLSVKFD